MYCIQHTIPSHSEYEWHLDTEDQGLALAQFDKSLKANLPGIHVLWWYNPKSGQWEYINGALQADVGGPYTHYLRDAPDVAPPGAGLGLDSPESELIRESAHFAPDQ